MRIGYEVQRAAMVLARRATAEARVMGTPIRAAAANVYPSEELATRGVASRPGLVPDGEFRATHGRVGDYV